MSYEKFDLESALKKLHIRWVRGTEYAEVYGTLTEEFTQKTIFLPSSNFQEVFSYGKELYLNTVKHTEEMRKTRLIWPFLYEIEKQHRKLRIWERISLDADATQDLTGEPDYCVTPNDFAPRSPYCIIMEAKREDFEHGWGQTLAAMRGAQIVNQKEGSKNVPIYGTVTTGIDWQFGKLNGEQYIIYPPTTINVLKTDDNVKEALGLLDIIFRKCEQFIE